MAVGPMPLRARRGPTKKSISRLRWCCKRIGDPRHPVPRSKSGAYVDSNMPTLPTAVCESPWWSQTKARRRSHTRPSERWAPAVFTCGHSSAGCSVLPIAPHPYTHLTAPLTATNPRSPRPPNRARWAPAVPRPPRHRDPDRQPTNQGNSRMRKGQEKRPKSRFERAILE